MSIWTLQKIVLLSLLLSLFIYLFVYFIFCNWLVDTFEFDVYENFFVQVTFLSMVKSKPFADIYEE